MRLLLATICLSILSGCGFLSQNPPKTLGEKNSSYSYIPLDPLPVSSKPGNSCENQSVNFKDVLSSLPDNAIRIAIGEFDASGRLTFGPVQVGASGKSYQVVLDYINADVTNIRFRLEKKEEESSDKKIEYKTSAYTNFSAIRVLNDNDQGQKSGEVIIPVYVGVGLRLTASISVIKGEVNLASLGAIAAGAQAGNVTGSMVVQTLGITGKQVATALPLPSELNATTIQNAILSLGTIKAMMYDNSSAIITPRVTGIYNPIGDADAGTINAIISELAKSPISWYRPCK